MIVDIQTASPPYKVSQKKAAEELKKRMAVAPITARLIDMASSQSDIESRYLVIPDGNDEVKEKFYSVDGNYIVPGTKQRMVEYERWSKKLVIEAVEKIFANNSIKPSEISKIVTISCTGFFAPGLDYFIMEHFKIPKTAKRLNIGFMGCAASLIGLNSAMESLSSDDETVNILMVSVELCSLHLQTEPTRDNILANMIFSDGCAAALLSDNLLNAKLKIVDAKSILFENSAEFMGWKIGNSGFEMILSSELPKIILESAVPACMKMIEDWGLKKEDIKYWALHPGGRAILDSLKKGLNLTEDEMLASRTVLKNYGNMSSASILFVLKHIMQNGKIDKDDYICAIAFGPGLTMETALLKGC
ncbi:MAG: type III polyketide synthase [Bacteroidota bacterium]|nr:type III polyketide synthase [Bacteroidota bacterium]